jgi:hypothetical protein
LTLTTGLSQGTEAFPEYAMLVTTEGGGENDDVAFVSLHVLDVLYEETHVFTAFDPLTLAHQSITKGSVIFGALFNRVFDRVCLLAVERDHPH